MLHVQSNIFQQIENDIKENKVHVSNKCGFYTINKCFYNIYLFPKSFQGFV